MTITKEQKTIILGMARNIMQDALKKSKLAWDGYSELDELNEAVRELDFSQRRLEVYLEGLVREGGK